MNSVLAELRFQGGGVFRIVQGDLLAEPVDAIVNAANGMLAHGGGVAAIISRAAGPSLQEASDRIVRERGVLPTGSAVLTTAGRLPFKGVIHAVGPRWGEGDEETKLIRALGAAFDCAARAGFGSVAFPAVSAGIFAVPIPVCARAYLAAVRAWFALPPAAPGGAAARPATSLVLIRLCLRDAPLIDAALAQLARGS